MRSRCNNKNNRQYDIYGGRGIKVDPRWDDFSNFLADMGQRPEGMSIDRIDCNGMYEPTNCRWATTEEQYANRRPGRLGTPRAVITPAGRFPTLTEAASHHQIVPSTVFQWIRQHRAGWSYA